VTPRCSRVRRRDVGVPLCVTKQRVVSSPGAPPAFQADGRRRFRRGSGTGANSRPSAWETSRPQRCGPNTRGPSKRRPVIVPSFSATDVRNKPRRFYGRPLSLVQIFALWRLRDDQFERLRPAARLRPWRGPVPPRTPQAMSLTEEDVVRPSPYASSFFVAGSSPSRPGMRSGLDRPSVPGTWAATGSPGCWPR